MKVSLTPKEKSLLKEVFECWHEDEGGYSEFTGDSVKTKSRAGVLSSLYKKGLIYDSYDNYDFDDETMWCMTDEGAEYVKSNLL